MPSSRTLIAAALFALAACKGDPAPSPQAPPPQASSSPPLVLAPADQVRWTEPPPHTTDVATAVHDALVRAKEDGRTLIVYVGATWCEPCQRFHHAVERGELDSAFPKLTVFAFDVDRDGEPLATAGYVSRLIPLFAMPLADGRASPRFIQGSVKGEEAVGEITPRLRTLIASE